MAIIKFTKKYTDPNFALLNRYPDQFVDAKAKEDKDWWKVNMDYFYNLAIQQYTHNRRRIVPNYELIKGILRRSDFYNEPMVASFTETLLKNEDLPSYVKHYNILSSPLNTMVGEMTKRPDNVIVKAFDDDSKSEELQFKTDILQKLVMTIVKQQLQAKAAQDGEELEEDDLDAMTAEKAEEYLTNYTSLAERWGARMLDLLKMRFSLREKSEDAFRDLLISAKQFYLIYPDSSPFGFNVRVINPKNAWFLSTQDTKYISNPLDPNIGAYAAGTIDIMEFSQIINEIKLTKDEIEHLRDLSQQGYLLNSKDSNLVHPGKAGYDSVTYDNYDPAVLQYRQLLEGEARENHDELSNLLGITSSAAVFGNKFLVIRAYWCSKKKIGELKYIDEDGAEQTTMVGEEYKSGMHPQQVSLEWGWINQWYEGIKIGLDIYYVKPVEILDYCPLIGCLFESKNIGDPQSLVDQMKAFQMLYNIAMNKLFKLTEKDIGIVFLTSIRHVPVPKDGAHQDALEMWEAEAREKGIIFIDDSPENLKAPSSFNQHTNVDLSRAREIQGYYDLAVQMRTECWKLIGISEQRLGESKATETATAINSALTQSYAQTESWFAQHEYTLNKLYQALLDAALKIESTKPKSTISYISTEGEPAFVQINGPDLKLKELGVFVTSRADDAQNFKEFRQLSQAMLQNGASPYEVSILYSTKSMRQMKDIFKKLKKDMDNRLAQEQQLKQQELEQSQAQFEKGQQLLMLQHEKDQAFAAYQAEQDRLSKEKIAMINAASKAGGEDINENGLPDVLEISKHDLEMTKAEREYQLKIKELTQRQQEILTTQMVAAQDRELQKEKLKMDKYKADMTLKVAKENKPPKPAAKK